MVNNNDKFASLILDTAHFIFAFLIILLSILVFLDTEANIMFFPSIFLLTAMICIVQIIKIYKRIVQYRYMSAVLCLYVFTAAFFVLLALISLVRM